MPLFITYTPRTAWRLCLVFLPVGLLLVLLALLSGCQPAQGHTDTPPQFITLINLHRQGRGAGVEKSVLHPNGSLYVIYSTYVGVISITALSHLITIPLPSGAIPDPLEYDYPQLRDIAVDNSSGQIYVTDTTNHFVHVISGTTIITAFSSLGMFPNFITFDPKLGYGYLSNYFASLEDRRIEQTVVLTHGQLLTQIERGHGQPPYSQFYNPVDGRLYIGHQPGDPALGEAPGGVVTVISGTALVTTTFLGNPELNGIVKMAVDRNSGAMYLLDATNRLVYWYGDAIRHLFLGGEGFRSTRDLAVDAHTGWAYVTSWNGNPSHVAVVDKDTVIAAIPVGEDPYAVAVDETHDYVYVANRLSGSLSVIRGTVVITTMSTEGWGPSYITLDEERGYIYVSNADSHSVAVFGFPESEQPSLWQRFLPFIQR